MKDYNHLLLDGKNILYRALYAGAGDAKFRENKNSYSIIFMRFLHQYVNKFNPDKMHIFWDSLSDKPWRSDILPEYKGTRQDHSAKFNIDVKSEVRNMMAFGIEICKELGIRQYLRSRQEADDLIYAFCKTIPESTVVISNDSDLRQLPYQFHYVDLYNPIAGRIEDVPKYNPALFKALTGDNTDNVSGYLGVGPVTAEKLTNNVVERVNYLKTKGINENKEPVGIDLLKRNRLLVDLSLCPMLLDNMTYIENRLASPIVYNYEGSIKILRKYKVNGAIDLVPPFARLAKHD